MHDGPMQTKNVVGLVVVGAALMGCAKKPTAMQTCQKLEAAGVASNCRAATPAGLAGAAAEKVDFDLVSVPGKTGQALRFDNEESYTKTVSAFTAAAALAGPHRYGSAKALVFVQLNDGAKPEVGTTAKGVVEGL